MSKQSRAKGRRHKNGRVKEQRDAESSFRYLGEYGYPRYQGDVKSPRDYQGKGYVK